MLYNLGDRFIVNDVLCHVAYINNKKAWVAPLEEDKDAGLFIGLTFNVLDAYCRDTNGNKAIVVSNQESQAV